MCKDQCAAKFKSAVQNKTRNATQLRNEVCMIKCTHEAKLYNVLLNNGMEIRGASFSQKCSKQLNLKV